MISDIQASGYPNAQESRSNRRCDGWEQSEDEEVASTGEVARVVSNTADPSSRLLISRCLGCAVEALIARCLGAAGPRPTLVIIIARLTHFQTRQRNERNLRPVIKRLLQLAGPTARKFISPDLSDTASISRIITSCGPRRTHIDAARLETSMPLQLFLHSMWSCSSNPCQKAFS